MIKTYTLPHELHLDHFFLAYNYVLNGMVSEIWENIAISIELLFLADPAFSSPELLSRGIYIKKSRDGFITNSKTFFLPECSFQIVDLVAH
jgi:hypothetical protein